MFDDVTFSWSQLFENEFQFIVFLTTFLSVFLLLFPSYPRIQYLAWPFGVIGSAGYFYLFREWQLYGSTILQVYFVILCLAGTWVWRGQLIKRTFKSNRFLERFVGAEELPTTHSTLREFCTVVFLAAIATVPVYFLLNHYKDAAPTWDGIILTLSAAAIYLQLKKKVESWPLWIAVDVVAIPLYFSQGNGGTGLLYITFIIQCFFGWYTWHKDAEPKTREMTLQDEWMHRG